MIKVLKVVKVNLDFISEAASQIFNFYINISKIEKTYKRVKLVLFQVIFSSWFYVFFTRSHLRSSFTDYLH